MVLFPFLLGVRLTDLIARHSSTMRLRLLILAAFWGFAIFLAPPLLVADPPVMLIVSLLFAVTTVSYLFIFRGIGTQFFFFTELAADVATITLLVHLTGGISSYFYLLYVLYTVASGLFYNWRVSAVCGLAVLLFYSALLGGLGQGWLPPPPPWFSEITFWGEGLLRNWFLLTAALAIAIYGVRLASHLQELRRNNLELARVSRAKSDFLATMSHELRTPLNAIIGFSELLAGGEIGSLNDDQQSSLKEIQVNGENLLRLINGLLDLAKIEAGKMELVLAPVDLNELIRRVEGMMGSLVKKKSLEFLVKTPSPLPGLYADEAKLQQVLVNLVSNAIKFTPDRGRITVEVQPVNRAAQLSVEDTGVGIPLKDQQRIFSFFEQATHPPGGKTQGTGIGLALAKQLIELHGGRIWVESEPGRGARFTIQLPRRVSS